MSSSHTDARTDPSDPAAAPPIPDHAIVVYSDIGCPWAHILAYRLDRWRRELGLDRELMIDHRAFPLELVNRAPTPKQLLDAEIPVLAAVEPGAGWSSSPTDSWTYPVSTLPALEAVQAAKEQSNELSISLDLALRRAMFEDWACLAVHGVVMDVAAKVEGLDTDRLWSSLGGSGPRSEVWHQFETCLASDAIVASPTVLLPDGSTAHNPGFEMHWTDGPGSELVIDENDADTVRRLVEDAVAMSEAD